MSNISKKIGLTVFLFLIAIQSCKVSSLYAPQKPGDYDPADSYCIIRREYSPPQMNLLLNSTTIFVLRNQDMEKKDDFIKAINKVWTLTPIIFLPYDSIKDYKYGNYTFFIVDGTTFVSDLNSQTYSHDFLSLNHYKLITNKKGKEQETKLNFARIELMSESSVTYGGEVDHFYNKENVIKNWTPGMLSLYLIRIQSKLNESYREHALENFIEINELKKLKNETLYVPSYTLDKVNKYNDKENLHHDENELFKNYPYPYVIIDADDLSKKIINREVNFVFEHVRDNTQKFIRVYSVQSGRIYQDYQNFTYNLKSKDIARIAKAIGK